MRSFDHFDIAPTYVVKPRPALTASFHGMPAKHDGRRLFGFEIRFSEEFQRLTLTALKKALQVTNGQLVDAKRTVRGRNRSVTVRVRPTATGTLTLALAAPSDCSAADAICASDGRKLSVVVSASVPGPAAPQVTLSVLSVADARGDEGETLAFAVTLDKAATGAVTVDYATADYSAVAGEGYTRTDLSMRLTAVGGRGALLEAGESGGLDLALKADAFFVETTSEAVSTDGDTSTDASRLRLVLEGGRAFATDSGGVFTPGLELGLRHDGGDAETGTGVELGGRVSYAHPHSGLSLDASIRTLIAHEDSDYREWGASGALRLAPGAGGRGLSFSLAPTRGTPSSGVDRLWSARDARGLAPTGGTFEPESRLEGDLGYGLPVFGGGFTGTPNLGFGFSNGGRDYRLGWRPTPTAPGASGFEFTLDATRREPVNDNGSGSGAAPEHGVMLRSAVRW